MLTYLDKDSTPVTPAEMGAAPGAYVAVVTLQGNYSGTKQQDIMVRQTTGMSEKGIVNSEKFATTTWYDLNGRKVTAPTKGVFIQNGKKVLK